MNSTKCSACRVTIKFKDEFAGRKMRCPKCSHIFILPAQEKAVKRPPVSAATPVPDEVDDDELQLGEAPPVKSSKVAPTKAGKKAPPPPSEDEEIDDLLAAAQAEMEPTAETLAAPKKGQKPSPSEDLETEEFSAFQEEEDGVVDWMDDTPAPPTPKGKTDKSKKAPIEEDDLLTDFDEEPAPPPRGKTRKPSRSVEDEEEALEEEPPAPKSKKPARGKKPASKEEDEDEERPKKKKKGGGLLLLVLLLVLLGGAGAAAAVFFNDIMAWFYPPPPRPTPVQGANYPRYDEPIVFKDKVEGNSPSLTADKLQLTFTDLKGTPVQIGTFKGKKNVVLVFMRGMTESPGGICPHCRAHTSSLIASYPKFQERDTEVILVFPGLKEESKEVGTLLEKAGRDDKTAPFPVVFDEGLKVVQQLGIQADRAKPATFILDKKGALILAYVGTDSSDRPSVTAMLGVIDESQPMGQNTGKETSKSTEKGGE